jgi:D-threo-aldose 1-dehydrogenase
MDPLELVRLGTSDVHVTRLGLGTAPLGKFAGPQGNEQAAAIMERACQLGVRYFDTAPFYGVGLSEERVGAALRTVERNSFVLSTKVGRPVSRGGTPDPQGVVRPGDDGGPEYHLVKDFSREGVKRSLADSLRRLGLQKVDIALIHDPDPVDYEDVVSGAYPALVDLRHEGMVGAIGAGMTDAPLMERVVRGTNLDCLMAADTYSLLDDAALHGLFPLCLERGVSVIAAGVFHYGILANPGATETYFHRTFDPEDVAKTLRIRDIAARWNVPIEALAMQFPFGHPAVCSVVVGVRSVQQIERNLEAFRIDIPADLWAELRAERLIPAEAPVPVVGA